MHEYRHASGTFRIRQRPLPCLVVIRGICVFPDRCAEHFRELRPVRHVVPLVYHPYGRLCEHSELFRFPDEEQVGVFVPGCSGGVRLVAQYEPAHRIHMLARYPVVVYPFPFAVELHEREPPEFRVQDVAYEAPEPRGAYLFVYRLVRLSVTSELDDGGEHGVFPFLDDTCQVRVHENVLIQVV
ncbi:hypothetical protein M089_0188 [Bacteroides ovatus str. 3725 D9 iii]|nr:hypothetical protein M088_5495 [Bacteroides ovatus str. 3725 D1 iv]KDS23806.1 hypothetical protein M088_5359 [Bacteroides ovatus str. 3725 D1 iv]KDS47360.1 hypothetical protein M089_0188 [Bacteroides ovatus str. 3725 D9 iii]